MTGWRGTGKGAGLLGIAVATALGLAACGTASRQTGAAAGVSASTTATPTSRADGSETAVGSGKGSGQAAPGTSGGVAERPEPEPRQTVPTGTLHVGDHGGVVKALQRRLAALGYETRRVDGEYGSSTSHAVTAFQKVNGLDRDGVAGPRTLRALAHPRTPRPRVGGRGVHVEADLTLQVIYIVDDGRIQQILDASSASGRTYLSHGDVRVAPTPEGSLRIERKVDGWHRSYLGLMYRPAYFDGAYAIHGASSVPPFPASHGCIRVTTTSMDWLYDRLTLGTRVLVYRT